MRPDSAIAIPADLGARLVRLARLAVEEHLSRNEGSFDLSTQDSGLSTPLSSLPLPSPRRVHPSHRDQAHRLRLLMEGHG